MSLYKDSTLAMIPTAYKDGKLYSVRPTDGSGDFTFSRGSNLAATRVASSGYIEKGRENLLLQSNTFSNASWTKTNSSVTAGQSGYDGGSDAWQVDISASFAQVEQTISTSGVVTYSVYAKAGTLGFVRLRLDASTTAYADFDLASGTAGTTSGIITTSSTSLAGGWYRLSLVTNASSATKARIYPIQADNDLTATSGNIYIQDAQLESGLVSTDVITTTTTSVSAGILEDMPRLDYSGGASCPSLLLEPQRSNIVTQSEYMLDFTKGADTSLTANAATSPEGENNATYFYCNKTTTNAYIVQGWIGTSGVEYAVSFYAKAKELNRVYIKNVNDSGAQSYFDLSDGTFTLNSGINSMSIEDAGEGWYRCTAVSTSTTTGIKWIPILKGDANEGVYVYGLQIEQGSYPTSYIPTYGSSVTRAVDSMSLTDLLGNDIVNTLTEGTLLLDLEVSGQRDGTASYRHFRMVDNTDSSTNRIRLWEGGAGSISTLRVDFTSGSIEESINADTQNKVVVSWGSSGTKIYKNGVNTDSTTSQLVFASTPKFLTSIVSNYRFNSILVFPTALTDSECIALTTL